MLAVVVVGVLAADQASAAHCGDDVDGRRVACACGDVVVGDATLLSDDPVVTERCAGDGLVVRAEPGAPAVHLDLAGQTLTGIGRGVGIRVLAGGDGGAIVTGGSGAGVVGFRNGIRATRPGAIAQIRDLDVRGCTSDGIVLRGDATRLVDVRAQGSGRDGLWLSGGVVLDGVVSERNARYGVKASGHTTGGVTVDGNALPAGGPAASRLRVEESR